MFKKQKQNNNNLTVHFSKSTLMALTKSDPITNKTVRSCVSLIASSIASTPLEYTYTDTKGETKKWNTGVIRLLQHAPNELMSAFDFWKKIVGIGLIKNDAYAWIVRDSNGIPVEILPIDSKYEKLVTPKNYPDLLFVQFTMRKDSSIQIISEDDLLHFRFQFTEDEYFGDDNEPLKEVVGIDSDLWKSVVSWSKNSASLKGVLTANGVLKEADIDKANDRFKSSFLNNDNSGGFLVLDDKFSYTAINNSSTGIDNKYTNDIESSIYKFFGVNEKLINSSASPQEIQSFYKLRLKPLFCMIEAELNRKLITLREVGFNHKFSFVGESLEHLSAQEKNATITLLTNLGCLTRNEIREAYGFAAIPGGDVLVYSKNFEEVSNSQSDTNNSDKQVEEEKNNGKEQDS